MSATLARACKVGALALTVGLIALCSQSAHGQTLKNRFTPSMPLTNNGSLYTAPNPTWPLPNQVPFMYTAVASQDCRLYHNGATLMPVNRLLAGLCTDMQPAQVPISNGFIPTYQSIFAQAGGGGGGGGNGGVNVGNNNGNNGGIIVLPPQFPFAQQQTQMQQAYQYQMYQAYQYQAMRNAAMNTTAYDNYRNYAGNAAPLPGNNNQAPFFNAVPNNPVGNPVGMNAVANPFAAFNGNRDDKDKDNKDKAKPDARKDDDALKPEERKEKDKDEDR